MKNSKKTLIIAVILVIISSMLINCYEKAIIANPKAVEEKPLNIAVLLYKVKNVPYVSILKQNFEEIQKKNEDKVKFSFYDSKGSQFIQDKTIDELLQRGDTDVIFLDIVNEKNYQEAIDKIKEKNIPVVLFHREPFNMDPVRSYSKAFFVGTNIEQAGRLEGKIIVDAWNKDKKILDRNHDNIIQYIMLIGELNNLDAIGRTKYSIEEINDAGISTQEIASKVCNWDETIAENIVETIFLKEGNVIEAIISNNDSMAIGAIKVLQKYGYNQGDKMKTILVVGVDAIPEAQELIKKGYMTGSVIQDASAVTEAVYNIGINLFYGRPPLYGTEYKIDDTGVAIRIPYKEYIKTNS